MAARGRKLSGHGINNKRRAERANQPEVWLEPRRQWPRECQGGRLKRHQRQGADRNENWRAGSPRPEAQVREFVNTSSMAIA